MDTTRQYLDTEERQRRYLDHCLAQDEVGWDTEYGEDKQVVVWSLATFRKDGLGPRGFRAARGYCLPGSALPLFAPLFSAPSVRLWAHNAVADTRSLFASTGILATNVQDTLDWVRVARPGLPKYGLKPLASLLLGKPPRQGFKEVLGYRQTLRVAKTKKVKVCSCGVPKCRKRLGHVRHDEERETWTEKEVDALYDLHEVVPGHERWAAWVAYSLEDAVDALELASYLHHAQHRLRAVGSTNVDPLGPEALSEVRRFLANQEKAC